MTATTYILMTSRVLQSRKAGRVGPLTVVRLGVGIAASWRELRLGSARLWV